MTGNSSKILGISGWVPALKFTALFLLLVGALLKETRGFLAAFMEVVAGYIVAQGVGVFRASALLWCAPRI